MTFLGLEKPIEYGRQLIFDPSTAQFVLDAQRLYAAALYNDYRQSLNDMKEFREKYGDFMTPILADQDWWNLHVNDPVKNLINDAYANGVDLLRSPLGRAMVSNLIASMPYGDMAKVRLSALNAREYQKARAELEMKGLYNPAIAKYDGPDLSTYSTADNGVWDKMSPTPYQNMADFSKAYFDNISPIQRQATKNGINYTISEVTEPMLYDIADRHFNDLVNTPQGQLMYKMYKDLLGSDELARQAFNDAVVSGNLDRRKYSDNYDQQLYRMENLAIKRQNLALRRAIAAARQLRLQGDTGGPGTLLQGVSLAQSWYDTAMANAYSKTSGYTKDWDQMHTMYGDFSKDAVKLFTDFGKKYSYKINPSKSELLNTETGKKYSKTLEYALSIPKNKRNAALKSIVEKAMKEAGADNSKQRYNNVLDAYHNLFTIPMDGKSVAEIIGTPLSDNKMVAKIGEGAIDKIFGKNDIITNTAGYTKTHITSDTKKIRDAIRKYGVNNTTITSMERGYGSLRKNTGSFEVNPEVKIVCTDNDGNVQFVGYGYYDIGLGSNSTKGGSYLGDYKTAGGAVDLGGYSINPRMKVENSYRGPVLIGVQRVPGLTYTPEYSVQEANMFPDYNRWSAFGVWDTDLTSKRLHAGQSEKLATYGNPYNEPLYDYDESLWDYDEDEE